MILYILSEFKLEAFEDGLKEFLADDLICILQSARSRIVVGEDSLHDMMKDHPDLSFRYKVTVSRVR